MKYLTMSNELTQRLEFYGLAKELGGLKRVGRKISGRLDRAINRFYEKVAATPAISGLFSGREQMDHAAGAQKSHWISMFEQGLDEGYFRRATAIGNVHAKIGLDPRWYIGGYGLILDQLITQLVAPGPLALLPWKRRQARNISLLVRASLLDMDIALSTYFVKAEEKIRGIVLGQMGEALSKLSEGDLTARMSGLPKEYARAEENFNSAMTALQRTISGVVTGIQSISTASTEIRAASDDLALRNEQQAANLEETAGAMNQVTGSVKETAGNAEEVRQSIVGAHREATEGGAVVNRAVEAMAAIEQSAQEISQIINVIDGIAFQTNLLALNAGVEAARAGDAGKGFAVVANEVRALAQRSADSAKDIKELITTSSEQVSGGVALVGQTGAVLDKIVNRVGEINGLVGGIAQSASMQATNLQQVNLAVNDMDRMTQQNAAMVEQSTAAARSLATEAAELAQLVARFRVGNEQPESQVSIPSLSARRVAAPRQVSLPTSGNLAIAASEDDWSEF